VASADDEHQADSGAMNSERWTAVEDYIAGMLLGEEPPLEVPIPANPDGSAPPGSIAANDARLLELLARMSGAREILEIGTLGGYSAIRLARAVAPGGRVITLEVNPDYAEIARTNIAAAGLADTVQVRLGAALQSLAALLAEGAGPFDLVFIDADKVNYPGYLEWSLKLSRAGTAIVVDNVVRAGRILDPDGTDARLGEGGIQGIRSFYEMLARDPRLSATVIQTVGSKGHDGFALAVVTDAVQRS
jgi:predicted O-methyltransferase YrrM